MKKYKVWVECEKTIKANSLDEAITELMDMIAPSIAELEFNGVELK